MEKAFQKFCVSWNSCETRMPILGGDCYTDEEYLNQLHELSVKCHRCGSVPGSATASLVDRERAAEIKQAVQASMKQIIKTDQANRRNVYVQLYKEALAEATQRYQDSFLRGNANVERHICKTTGCVCTPLDEYGQEENGASTSLQ